MVGIDNLTENCSHCFHWIDDKYCTARFDKKRINQCCKCGYVNPPSEW